VLPTFAVAYNTHRFSRFPRVFGFRSIHSIQLGYTAVLGQSPTTRDKATKCPETKPSQTQFTKHNITGKKTYTTSLWQQINQKQHICNPGLTELLELPNHLQR